MDYPFPYEVFNLGESSTVTLKELVETLERVIGKPAVIQSMDLQPGDVEITYADVSKARKLLGYSPSTSITKGLTLFNEWYVQTR
jgi:UDP-glucuronate 4-epimerase